MCACVSALCPLVLRERLNTWRTHGLYMCMNISHQPSGRISAADLSVFVHRAIFTYEGFTNKLKLADSGGKEDCVLPLAFRDFVKSLYICGQRVLSPSSLLTAGGVAELAGKFHISKPQYGLCRVGNNETGAVRIALISWVSSRQAV